MPSSQEFLNNAMKETDIIVRFVNQYADIVRADLEQFIGLLSNVSPGGTESFPEVLYDRLASGFLRHGDGAWGLLYCKGELGKCSIGFFYA
jgi:hypothetical protein